MKTCAKCKESKPLTQFQKYTLYKDGLHPRCKSCLSDEKAEDYRKKWFKYQVRLKKAYCKKVGIPFDLTEKYLKSIWTETCPIYGVPFVRHDKKHPNCPALDRLDPNLGYVKGNVVYISSRANRIKYDASTEELKLILAFMEGATTIPKGSTLK